MDYKNKLLLNPRKIFTYVVNRKYSKMNASITHRLIEQGLCKLNDDCRFDSSGYNAKYVTYPLMNQKTNEVIAFSVTQVKESGN